MRYKYRIGQSVATPTKRGMIIGRERNGVGACVENFYFVAGSKRGWVPEAFLDLWQKNAANRVNAAKRRSE